MSLTVQKNNSITRNLAAKVDEKEIIVARLTGQVTPDTNVTFSMAVADKTLAAANRDDLAAAFDVFLEELRAMARENGLPV